ncbi:hypothetical protein ASF96_05045 [Microbacterium sp. Leaf179]|nr:hypothetical protein ASF96_05045 [Microbacterium sp. Leaf179]
MGAAIVADALGLAAGDGVPGASLGLGIGDGATVGSLGFPVGDGGRGSALAGATPDPTSTAMTASVAAAEATSARGRRAPGGRE